MSNQGQGANSTAQGGQTPNWADPKPTAGPKIGGLTPINNQAAQPQASQPSAPGTPQYQQLNQGLQTKPMQVASNILGGNGVSQAGQGAMAALPGMGAGPGAAQGYLGGTAQGDYLGGSPYLKDILEKSNRNVADQTNQLFSAGGRYGSGSHQGTLADSIASNTSNLLNTNYQQERDRQMQAAGAISGEQQNRLGLQSNNIMNAAQIGQQGISNQLNTISQLPTIQGNKIFDAQQQMGIGQQLDQRNQQQLNDLINRWTQGDMQGWSRLGGLLSAAGQAAGSWGTQSGSSSTSSSPSPLGMAGTALSMMSKSDRRAKKNIRRVGTLENGLPVYAYRYKSGGPTVIGVMADEVRKVKPWAVTPINGIDHVQYDLAVA